MFELRQPCLPAGGGEAQPGEGAALPHGVVGASPAKMSTAEVEALEGL